MVLLQTAHTTYGMRVMETGHLEHLYYGERITVDSQDPASCAPLVIQRAFAPGNTCTYDREHPQISMEDVCLEVGTLGKGDIREPFWKSDLPTEVSPLTLLLIPIKLLL